MAEKKNGNGKSKPTNGEPNSEYDNFQQLLKETLSVSKENIEKRRQEEERGRRAG